ncbi:MAG: DNA cytosine methyltransferase [Rickettsiales bacterium]|nr:DNA cytosine methyltransferase [Pseudomonadota bacterium]MDA0965643.1 DNA cytosine methyltransferase [Pseudomonadota bacterium]MDG4542967.1 DNA cytosine methyltransferase [Rickettsiales bacterium]MDG4544585.1 DNA cytosine methyltransferase [Rickettsiales bacterium]MDG4546707.1 DNA cytosine methyltransferase [Rickettsiales bacterium]
MKKKYKFIDLFAGIGGFHYAFHELGAECVFASEIAPHARKTYEHNLKVISPKLFKSSKFNDDILKIAYNDIDKEIPDFDILCAGFPCQPFSQAGFKRGFKEEKDSRGNMFFKIRDIIKVKKPKAIFLENVRHLLKHDNGQTFAIIKNIIDKELKYDFHYEIVKASDFGLPQHRPRLFMVGFRKEDKYELPFEHPKKVPLKMTMSDILGGKCNKEVGYTLRVGGRGSGLSDRRNWDSYLVNNEHLRITSKEGLAMQGFPANFQFPVSETQAMKQLGNSVAVNAIRAYGSQIINRLNTQIKDDVKSDCYIVKKNKLQAVV